MPLESLQPQDLTLADARWQARVDLAAAHRLAVMHGFNEGIFNHLTLRVPGTEDRYYQIPFGTHWSEVTASCFMEVGYDGSLLAGEGEIERSAYCIHAPIHKAIPAAAAVFHTHMPFVSALSRLEDPTILPIGQTELGTMMNTAYDLTYTGLAFDPAEGERLAGVIGDKTILIMANHGVATVGKTVAEAYDRLYYIERVAQVQLYAMWTGKPLKMLPQDVIDGTIASFKASGHKYGGKSNAEWHFAALKRILDRKEPDYKE
ncbi:MAG: Ribulose-5-phosphate 4-epimerase/Fuculose-phosphate aldolase [Belnapia sp.]|nr:Ribulose-5-phosphate 4-epimerase/Fuculose-phosphate aldolase [Belnapia sp.]